MIFQHGRYQIWNIGQHPYRHAPEDIAYTTPAAGGLITNIGQAFDWVFAVLYPNTEAAVATPAALPLVGNNFNDYRVVLDDGDGKQAGYRWEQREGDVAPKWYKIYDFDWSSDAILAAFLDITQDEYVHKAGRDDADEFGVPLAGAAAGQHVYGGLSASTHLTLHANAGDGVGAQTGFVQTEDPFRPIPGVSVDLGTNTERWAKIWQTEAQIGTLNIVGGSITDSSGAIDFGNETLTTSTTVTAGTLTIGSGSITDTSGAISFGNENLTTTGRVTAFDMRALGAFSAFASGTTIGTLTLSDGSIIDSTGNISFGNENLLTTGTLGAGDTTVTRLDSDNIRLDGNAISVLNVNGGLSIAANGTGVIDMQSAMTTIGQTVTGTMGITGILNIDNLRLDGNTITSQNANGDIELTPNGTGVVLMSSHLIPLADNSRSLGATANRFANLYLGGTIDDGADAITVATLMSFRDANVGVAVGDALFWTGTKWEASNPDTEIDHGELSGLGDDDHTQYALLLGRAGGQTLAGSNVAGESLYLTATTDANKGAIIFDSNPQPLVTNFTDLGQTNRRWKDFYMQGQAYGLRLENAANAGALPAASASNPGRMAWVVDSTSIYVDTGGTWLQVSTDQFYLEDAAGWTGAVSSVSYDVSATVTNAKRMVWQFKDNANNYRVLKGADITHTSNTNVTVTFDINLTAGTYTLVGR